MTMASSTTIPSASRKANVETMLIVWPVPYTTRNAPATATGTPMRHPEGQPKLQEQAQDDEHQDQPHGRPFVVSVSSRSVTRNDWSS